MGESKTATAADASSYVTAQAVPVAQTDRSVPGRANVKPSGHQAAADVQQTSATISAAVGSADLQLIDAAARLQHAHRCVGGGCAAGCRESMPCLGHRLAEHALRAASGPWHVQHTVRIDLAASGVLVSGGASDVR